MSIKINLIKTIKFLLFNYHININYLLFNSNKGNEHCFSWTDIKLITTSNLIYLLQPSGKFKCLLSQIFLFKDISAHFYQYDLNHPAYLVQIHRLN